MPISLFGCLATNLVCTQLGYIVNHGLFSFCGLPVDTQIGYIPDQSVRPIEESGGRDTLNGQITMANHLRALREKANLSQDALAARMGTTRSQYVKLERGERRLTEKWIERAAAALGVPPGRIIDVGTVPLAGFVGAGAELFYFQHADGNHLDEVEAPPQASDNTVAVQVKGDSMRGIADEGYVLYYDNRQQPVTDDLLDHLCVVGLPDGRMMVKKLQRGRYPGLFHLYSSNSDPIFDQPVDWAAKVTWIRPR